MTLTHLLAGTILVGTIVAFAIPDPPAAWNVSLTVERVIDGDTLKLSTGERIRLAGIDAPERDQICKQGFFTVACGQQAWQRLADIVALDPNVTCSPQSHDRYNRTIAVCSNRGGDLGRRMVAQGLALAYRRYSTMYVDEEDAARREGLGIWAGTFETPEKYRHSHTK